MIKRLKPLVKINMYDYLHRRKIFFLTLVNLFFVAWFEMNKRNKE